MHTFHGSDLEKIEQVYGIRKEEITGFGANVNPLGLSPLLKDYLAKHLDVLCAYPDRNYTALRAAISWISTKLMLSFPLTRSRSSSFS